MKSLVALFTVAGLAAAANATGTAALSLTFSDAEITSGETQTVQIWCSLTDLAGGDTLEAFGGTILNVLASANANGAVTSHTIENGLANIDPPGDTTVINGNNLENMSFLQLSFSGYTKDNPILLATFTWETTDYTNRTVDYSTDLSPSLGLVGVLVKNSKGKIVSENWAGTDGRGSFNVTPAPASLALLGLGGLAAGRRRR